MKSKQRPQLTARQTHPVAGVGLSSHLYGLLRRLRLSLPLPCTPKQAYTNCLPPYFLSQWRDPDLPLGILTNMRATIATTNDVSAAVHISLASQAMYKVAAASDGIFDMVFWVQLDTCLPSAGSTPFWAPLDHPHRCALATWMAKAAELEEKIQRAHTITNGIANLISSQAELAFVWPELGHFAGGLPIRAMTNDSRRRCSLLAHARDIAPTDKREEVIELLSTATLLSNADANTLPGWVHTAPANPY